MSAAAANLDAFASARRLKATSLSLPRVTDVTHLAGSTDDTLVLVATAGGLASVTDGTATVIGGGGGGDFRAVPDGDANDPAIAFAEDNAAGFYRSGSFMGLSIPATSTNQFAIGDPAVEGAVFYVGTSANGPGVQLAGPPGSGITISAGVQNEEGGAGNVNITSGDGTTGAGGTINITAGANSGTVNVTGGSNGGTVNVTAGNTGQVNVVSDAATLNLSGSGGSLSTTTGGLVVAAASRLTLNSVGDTTHVQGGMQMISGTSDAVFAGTAVTPAMSGSCLVLRQTTATRTISMPTWSFAEGLDYEFIMTGATSTGTITFTPTTTTNAMYGTLTNAGTTTAVQGATSITLAAVAVAGTHVRFRYSNQTGVILVSGIASVASSITSA